jgi:hypothetical protein
MAERELIEHTRGHTELQVQGRRVRRDSEITRHVLPNRARLYLNAIMSDPADIPWPLLCRRRHESRTRTDRYFTEALVPPPPDVGGPAAATRGGHDDHG